MLKMQRKTLANIGTAQAYREYLQRRERDRMNRATWIGFGLMLLMAFAVIAWNLS